MCKEGKNGREVTGLEARTGASRLWKGKTGAFFIQGIYTKKKQTEQVHHYLSTIRLPRPLPRCAPGTRLVGGLFHRL